jgi:Putative adhesin
MSLSNFSTPSPIAIALDLYVADVRFAASDRTDTIVEVKPSDPDKAADIKAAENTRVEYDDATRTLSIVSRKPLNRFVNFSSKRPDSVDIVIQLPTDSDVHGETELGDFQSDGVLGSVELKTNLGAVRLAETGALNLRSGAGQITVEGVTGSVKVHSSSSDIRIGTVDGTADVSTSNGKVRVGVVTGAASIKAANGSVSVDRALSDVTAASSNGEVRIGEVARGKVSATSKNGGVEVGVREGSAAWLDLNTSVGRVYNELASADAPEASEPVDKVEVHASTSLGDVTIRRAPRLDEEA